MEKDLEEIWKESLNYRVADKCCATCNHYGFYNEFGNAKTVCYLFRDRGLLPEIEDCFVCDRWER